MADPSALQADVVPTPVPTDDTPITTLDTTSDSLPIPTDDQVALPSSLDPAESEQEPGLDSAISLAPPSDDHQQQDEQIQPEAVDADSQGADQLTESVMETEEFATSDAAAAASPDGAPDGVIDPATTGDIDSTAMDAADPYDEQDKAYKDTELVSSVPVPSSETATPEPKADQSQADGEGTENQTDGQPAKATPSGKSQGANNNRHFQKGGRGGYHNNRNHHNNSNFQNNNNNNNNSNRPFNQRPFNNHHNQSNNNNSPNNYNNSNSNSNNTNHNNHGGSGPMRRGGYRGKKLFQVSLYHIHHHTVASAILPDGRPTLATKARHHARKAIVHLQACTNQNDHIGTQLIVSSPS